ncbi:hypothetical protein ACFLZT_05370 [Thermodesulfobacteriota bacterium]
MLKVGFYIPRLNYLKFLGPLIEYFLSQKVQVTLFCDHREPPSRYKAYLYPNLAKLPEFQYPVDRVAFGSLSEFTIATRDKGIQAMFFCNCDEIGKEFHEQMNVLSHKLIIAQMQNVFDLIVTSKDLSYSDVIYIYSDDWIDWWKSYVQHHHLVPEMALKDFLKDVDEKTVSVGFTEADQIPHIDPHCVREKYDIPANKKVLLYSPFSWARDFSLCGPSLNRLPKQLIQKMRRLCCGASKYLPNAWCGMLDRSIVEAVRKFCDRNNALFIVKAREKTIIPYYLEKTVDRIFFDESYYPYTLIELLSITDLCLHFHSCIVMEAVITRTPSISISHNSEACRTAFSDRLFISGLSPQSEGLYNFNGVNYYLELDEFVHTFPSKKVTDYPLDKELAKTFMNKFVSSDDLNSSSRIYNDLSKRINSLDTLPSQHSIH